MVIDLSRSGYVSVLRKVYMCSATDLSRSVLQVRGIRDDGTYDVFEPNYKVVRWQLANLKDRSSSINPSTYLYTKCDSGKLANPNNQIYNLAETQLLPGPNCPPK